MKDTTTFPYIPLVSVVVPAYNSEQYLWECINSIRQQTYQSLEIILVDDGSTDSTADICEQAAQIDERIKVIHKVNGGLSEARNTGINASKGEYICFVDSDDVVLPEMIESLTNICIQSDVKMAQGRTVRLKETKILPVSNEKEKLKVYSSEEAIKHTLYQAGVENSACGNLYHRSVFDKLRFRPGTWYEDLDIFYLLMTKSERLGVTDKPVYIYRQHSGSFIHRFNRHRIDVLEVTDRMLEWIRLNRPELTEAALTRRLSAHINILGLMEAYGEDMPEVRQKCEKVIANCSNRSIRNKCAKRSLRSTMILYKLFGITVLKRILALGYKYKERK